MPRFLIIQTAFIGDAVLATGILEKLHHHFPDAQIDFLVRKGNEGLLKDHPFLSRLLVWDKKKDKLANLWRLLKEIRSANYDKVINVQRYAATGFLTAFSGAKERIGYTKNPFSFLFTTRVRHLLRTAEAPRHEIERCNDLIEHFTDGQVFLPRLYPAAEDERKIAPLLSKPFIVVAPASVWFTKQYPAEKWIAFLDRVPGKWTVYLIGASNDEKLIQTIVNGSINKNLLALHGQLSFLQSAALMQKARMNFVNDSAPLHFASAVNAPVSAIYCSTVPTFGFGPLSDNAMIIETRESLSCRPCGSHGHASCPQKHFRCALGIGEEELLDQLRD